MEIIEKIYSPNTSGLLILYRAGKITYKVT
jgi:hypothetical protein